MRVVAPSSVNRGSCIVMRLGVRALADEHVEPEVLHRRIEVLLDDRREAVDLVDEQRVALAERR